MTLTVQPVCAPCYLILYMILLGLFLLKWEIFSSHFPKSVAFVSYWIRSDFQAMATAQNLGAVELHSVQEKDAKIPLENKKICMVKVVLKL